MKVKVGEDWGRNVDRNLQRVNRFRELAGNDVALMVDANGGYSAAQARRVGAVLGDLGVMWFEEPVSSDDVDGLAVVRRTIRCDVAAGEYVSDAYDARRLTPVVGSSPNSSRDYPRRQTECSRPTHPTRARNVARRHRGTLPPVRPLRLPQRREESA
jgi:hypothetical protein